MSIGFISRKPETKYCKNVQNGSNDWMGLKGLIKANMTKGNRISPSDIYFKRDPIQSQHIQKRKLLLRVCVLYLEVFKK